MALTDKERKQVLVLLIVAAVAGSYFGTWQRLAQPMSARISDARREIDSLRAQVDSARADLATGTVEQLRQRVVSFETTLGLMRQLVPGAHEVPNLIDDISTRAQLRGVEITDISPLAPQIELPFQVHRYQLRIVGQYDQIGEFLSDIATLQRIMVPYDLSLGLVPGAIAADLGEFGGTPLEASVQLRTFVKAGSDILEGGAGGAP